MTGNLRQNGFVISSLGSALRDGEHGLHTVPGLLKRVLADGSWREFVTERGEHVEYERFAEFVATPPLKGIGSSVDLVRRIVADDKEALDLLDQALQNPVGHPTINNNIKDKAPQGTSQEQALRRLRKEAESGNEQAAELHADVLAGNLSAHAAMVRAGFRPKTFTVRADDATSTARSLRKHMSPDALERLARLLTETEEA